MVNKLKILFSLFAIVAFTGAFPSSGSYNLYRGPCDIISCGEAYSVTHALVASYNGPLFQLNNGSSTLDIGQANHRADMSTWSAFCSGVAANCTISKVYAQIHTTVNDLAPFNAGSAHQSTFTIEAATGLPLWISQNTGSNATTGQAYTIGGAADNAATGITASGTAETVVLNEKPSTVTNSAGGVFGTSHIWNSCCVGGSDYLIFTAFGFGPSPPANSCITAQTFCVGLDEECLGSLCSGGFFNSETADYSVTQFPGAVFAITYDPPSNKVAVYVNGVQLVNQTPANTLQSGQRVHYGGGGDLSGPVIVQGRDMFITNSTLTQAQVTAVTNNLRVFYPAIQFPSGPNNPATYVAGPGDIAPASYFNSFRAYSAAVAAAGTQPLIAVANRTSTHICNILVNAAGGLGNTTGCSFPGDNGQSIVQFCTSPTTINTSLGQPEMDCQMQEVFDQTGNGVNYVNLTSPAPIFVPHCINFTPCALFQGTSRMGAAITLSAISQPYTTIELAERVTGTSPGGAVVLSHEGAALSFYTGFYTPGNAFIQTNTGGTFPTISAAETDGLFHILYGIFNGASSSLVIDGSTTTGSLGTDAAGANPTIRWGNRSASDLPLTGNISETGLWPSALTAQQQSDMLANQRNYWGF